LRSDTANLKITEASHGDGIPTDTEARDDNKPGAGSIKAPMKVFGEGSFKPLTVSESFSFERSMQKILKRDDFGQDVAAEENTMDPEGI